MRLMLALVFAAAPAFAVAEEVKPAPETGSEGFSLIEEGAKLVLRGLMTEMEPALDEMGKALSGMEPALKELGPRFQQLIALIDDFKNYDAPEMLPNGDIIIRRNAPLAPETSPEADPQPGPNGEIEL